MKTFTASNIKLKTHWAILVNDETVIYCENKEVAEFMAKSFKAQTHKVSVVQRDKEFGG